ncbi:type II secretion system F family protein [Thalassovita aquimarina]|uniref:Type II secretion system F family protein n=1 Tax=Thalassovita aquimarina TaxID=2785917 RepID=A0ABS5HN35_9RHOB|nr:type II secretion system F family protein [Thalassovita aquimarina]MBR9650357.1 type II secretion system F family protein [Thalassovita aquimarina]
MLNSLIVIYGLVFASALLLVEAAFQAILTSRREAKDVQNRLEALKLKVGGDVAYSQLLMRRGVRGDGSRQDLATMLWNFYAQSGLETSVSRRIIYAVVLFLIGFALTDIFLTNSLFAKIAIGVLLTLLVAFVVVYVARARRIRKFTAQLAPALDIIVRSLSAGHPLTAAIGLVAREMPDPIGSEFGILADQITFGSELEDAMLNMIVRVGSPELNLLAVTVSVQRGTGGNLSEILENLAQMLRDRLMLRAKIRAISAEGRFTAWFMMLFPFGLFAMIRSMVPTYFDPLWESGYGTMVFSICIIFMIFGFFIVRRLVNFDF